MSSQTETMTPWTEIHPGVWKATVGRPSGATPLAAAGGRPRAQALAELPPAAFPFPREHVSCERVHGKLHLSFPLGPQERIYGLGLTFRSLAQLHQVKRLQMDHYQGRDDGRTHAPMPLYVSGAGHAVLLDAARYVRVYVGTTHPRTEPLPIQDRLDPTWTPILPGSTVDFVLDAPGVDLLVFGGPGMLGAVRRYNLFCGGGCLPPKWGLGFWHRSNISHGAAQCLQTVERYRERGIPLSVLGLEPGWHSGCYPTTHDWRRSLFPDPRGFVAEMAKRGVRVNLWQNPFIHPDCALGRAIEPYAGSHLGSWGGLIPDLTMPEAREAMQAHFRREHVDIGVSGYKHDEADDIQWLFPEHATFPSGASAEEVHSVLGLALQRLSYGMFRAAGRRTYGLTRASNLGAPPLPYALYNDSYEHEEYVTAMCSASLGGLLWCPEARTSRTPEEWLRRYQVVCLSPLAMVNAWASDEMPWSYPEVAAGVRDAILLRARLLPYLYGAFADYCFRGIPPVRAMALEAGFPEPDVHDQYMLGPSILVAPVFAGKPEREVLLPPGRWFDFHTGEEVRGPRHTVISRLGPIPLFVRDGGIVPLRAEGEPTDPTTPWKHLEVRVYGDAEGTFSLYDDDGETFAYEGGAWRATELSAERGSGRARTSREDLSRPGPELSWRFMTGSRA